MNIYQSLYDVINTYIYGGGLVAGSYEELVCVLMSTIGVIALVSIPFVIVKKVIDLFAGR